MAWGFQVGTLRCQANNSGDFVLMTLSRVERGSAGPIRQCGKRKSISRLVSQMTARVAGPASRPSHLLHVDRRTIEREEGYDRPPFNFFLAPRMFAMFKSTKEKGFMAKGSPKRSSYQLNHHCKPAEKMSSTTEVQPLLCVLWLRLDMKGSLYPQSDGATLLLASTLPTNKTSLMLSN